MTENQQKCLDVIAEFMRENRGVSPTYQEIADLMGFKSKSMAYNLVETLVRDGHVTRSLNLKRSIQLVNNPWTAVAEAAREVVASLLSENINDATGEGTILISAKPFGNLEIALETLKEYGQ